MVFCVCRCASQNITVMADIVINGCLASTDCLSVPPKMDPFACVSTYCAKFPTVGLKISGNYHGMDTPAAVKMNRTNTAGSDIAWGAYLGIAMVGADISDNSCTGGGCENEPRSCPHCNDGKPVYGDPDGGEPPPLVVGGERKITPHPRHLSARCRSMEAF